MDKSNHSQILEELPSLAPMRVQKVFGLFNSAVVLETYSAKFKRLFLVFDQNQQTKSLHVQKTKPMGVKTTSNFILLLNKHVTDKWISSIAIAKKHLAIACALDKDDLLMVFAIGPDPFAALYHRSTLLAATKRPPPLELSSIDFQSKSQNITIKSNFIHAERYRGELLSFHQGKLFHSAKAQLKKVLLKKQKLLNNVQKDWEKCQRQIALEPDAELLAANTHLIARGATKIEVVDYTLDPPGLKKIAVDPKIDAKKYVDKLFHQIKRAKRGMKMIAERLDSIKRDVDLAQGALDQLIDRGADAMTLPDVLPAPLKIAPINKKTSERKPFKTYLSSDNVKILVGRSAKDSDDLIKHHLKGKEWWLHARDVRGAHVVIKSIEDNLPHRTLIEAAILAAHFSDDRASSSVEIQYTRAKNVKKPKKMAPGKVLVAKEKSISVIMDEQKLKRILATEIAPDQTR